MFLKHTLMDEEIAPEEPAGSGGTMDAPADGNGTESTPAVDYTSELDAEFKKLTDGAEVDDQSDSEPADDEGDVDDHSDDASGEPVDDTESAFDSDLVDRARLFGIEGDDLNAFGSPEELERTLFFMGSRLFDSEAQGQPAEQQQAEPTKTQPEPTEAPKQQQTGELEGWRKDFKDPDQFDPVFGQFTDEFDQVKAELAELRELKTHFDQQQATTISQRFDEVVGGLGGVFGEVYGNGQPTQGQIAKRQELFQKVAAWGGSEGLANPALVKTVANALNQEEVRKELLRENSNAARRNASKRMIRSGKSRNHVPPTAEGDDPVSQDADKLFKEMIAAQ